MKKNYIKRLLVFFTVIIIFSLVYIPLFNDLKFGLDLKGGFEVLYQVKRSDGKRLKSGDLNSTYDVLKRNVDSLGVSEPEIRRNKADILKWRIIRSGISRGLGEILHFYLIMIYSFTSKRHCCLTPGYFW